MRPPFPALWKKAPLVRIAVPVFAGIMLQNEWTCSFYVLVVLFFSFLVSFILVSFLSSRFHYHLQSLQGIFLCLLLFLFGMELAYQHDVRHDADWIGHHAGRKAILIFSLNEPPTFRPKSYKAEAAAEWLYEEGKFKKIKGKLIIYFSKETDASFLKYGVRMAASVALNTIRSSGNPGDFDYAAYARKRNIFHSVYLRPDNLILLSGNSGNRLFHIVHDARARIVSVFKKYLSGDPAAAGLAEALVIGYKEDLDKDLIRDYTNTGVVHVIAISGMHLALVFFMLEWIWKITGIGRKKILSGLLSILLLWFFSFLTGGSPSVLRSAIMFSLVITGRIINRDGSVFNSLTASALLLVFYDPFLLWDAGFILSHLAVLGLISLQKPLCALVEIRNKWLGKVWEMMMVTTAAQIFTLPFCLYYFHQFPNYFLISNLVIIPLSTIILFGGILLIIMAPIPVLAFKTGILLEWLIRIMNGVATSVSRWPGALSGDIYLSPYSLWLLYTCIWFFTFWLALHRFHYLRISMAALVSFFFFQSFSEIRFARQQKVIVYNIKGHSATDIVLGDRYFFWGDSLLSANAFLQDSLLSVFRKSLSLSRCAGSYDMADYPVWHIGEMSMALAGAHPVKADILMLNGQSPVRAPMVVSSKARLLLADGSCKLWKIEKLKRLADSLHLHCHRLPLQGAWIRNLPSCNASL